METSVSFRLTGTAEDLDLYVDGIARFTLGSITVFFSPILRSGRDTGDCEILAEDTFTVSAEAGQAFQNRRARILERAANDSEVAAQASASQDVKVGRQIRRDLRSLSRGDLKPGDLTPSFGDLDKDDIDWLFTGYGLDEVLETCEDARRQLLLAASRLVQLMRWIFGLGAPAKAIAHVRLEWSLDGQDWLRAPQRVHEAAVPFVGEQTFSGFELNKEALGAVQALLESDEYNEPVARQILLEAVAVQFDNPRAAVVLAIVAAEAGIKSFASTVAQGESEPWLLRKLQSPPLRDLMKSYLPLLTDKRTSASEAGEKTEAIPRSIRSPIESGVTLRNGIVHRGEDAPDDTQVAELLAAVNDLLYLLDWFRGHDWAFGRLREDVRKEYQLPEQ